VRVACMHTAICMLRPLASAGCAQAAAAVVAGTAAAAGSAAGRRCCCACSAAWLENVPVRARQVQTVLALAGVAIAAGLHSCCLCFSV
jgi:hypothetical protein